MTDETSVAFDGPEARAQATACNTLLDRISVRDYLVSVEIGAFQSERGVKQSVRFNVVVEVARHTAMDTDDVDLVLSYDTIIQAIETRLAAGRLELLETLAERIADQILQHKLAQRVFIRIEKLDRIPGALGVEIVRNARERTPTADLPPCPAVMFLPNTIMRSANLAVWLDAIAAHPRPAVICLEKIPSNGPSSGKAEIDRRLGLLSIEQNAWILAGLDSRCVVVNSRTELDWGLRNSQLSVWSPSKMVLDAVHEPKAGPDDPLALAQWFADEFSAQHVFVCGSFAGAKETARLTVAKSPGAL